MVELFGGRVPVKSTLPAGVAVLGLLVTPVTSYAQPAATATAATNPLLRDWTGPYGGTPP